MTIRAIDEARLANLRACLASISARAEAGTADAGVMTLEGRKRILQMIHDAAEAALKADEREGGKTDQLSARNRSQWCAARREIPPPR